MKTLQDLARTATGGTARHRSPARAGARPGPSSAIKILDRLPAKAIDAIGDVSEQREEAPIQGTFPVKVIRWIDITVFMVEGFKDAAGEMDPASLEALSAKNAEMLEFVNAGIVVFEDDFELIMLHSMSLQPGRTEFWMFPKAVILGEQTIGAVAIEGNGVTVV